MFSTPPLSPEFISVLVVTFILATVTIVPLRFISKWKLNAAFLLEDWLILGASIFAVGPQWTLIKCVFPASLKPRILPLNIYQAAFAQELGCYVEHNGSNAQIGFRKKTYACQLLYILAICLTKLSILAFYWRNFRPSQTMQMLIGAMVVVIICGSMGFFITSIFQCNSIHEVWDIAAEDTCIDTYVLFLIYAAFNFFTNFNLLVIPLHSVWKLQIPLSKKFMISYLLTIGGLIIIISSFRLCNLMHLDLTSTNLTWKMIFLAIWFRVEMQFGIFYACILSLRSLFSEHSHQFQNAAGERSQKLVESDENFEKTIITRAWAERGQGMDEEKWSQEIDEGKGPPKIMVTKVIEWSIEK